MSDRLDAALSVLASEPVDVDWADVERRLTVGASGPDGDKEFELAPAQTGPGRLPLLAVAAALVVVALLAVVLGMRGDQDLSPAEIGPSPEPSVAPTTGDPATRSARWSAVTAWTGTHYLVWGGETGDGEGSARADGWMFEPGTGEVTDVPAAPIAPRSGAAGVWTGTELVVCCGHAAANTEVGRTGTAAAFDPSTGTWRRLADPPLGTPGPSWFGGAAVWTGEEVLVVLSNDSGPSTVVAYDPEADWWRAIDGAPPRLGNRTAAAWTGEELIVWPTIYPSRAHDSDGRIPRPDIVGHRYDPAADRWEPLPPMPETSAVDMPSIAWTGDELVVVGVSSVTEDRMTGARWDPDTGDWRPLPDAGLPPIDWYNGTPGSQGLAWDDEAGLLLVLPPHGYEWEGEDDDSGPPAIPILAYDPSTDRWQHLDPARLGYAPDLAAAAGVLLQPDPDQTIVLRYGPGPAAGRSGDPEAISIDVPAGWTVARSGVYASEILEQDQGHVSLTISSASFDARPSQACDLPVAAIDALSDQDVMLSVREVPPVRGSSGPRPSTDELLVLAPLDSDDAARAHGCYARPDELRMTTLGWSEAGRHLIAVVATRTGPSTEHLTALRHAIDSLAVNPQADAD